MSNVYVFLADGFEEIEGLTVVDLLRRAGISVITGSIMGRKAITGSHQITVTADTQIEEIQVEAEDCLVLPGGIPGTRYLGECERLKGFLVEADARKSRIAAICAAPTVLGSLGFLKGKRAVCYPGMEEGLLGAEVSQEEVVTDGHITTSRGLGTAIAFALELVTLLKGNEEAERLARSVVYTK